jgi:hypothetical protein
MPKSEIDYSNTIIYKITCKDTNIKDIYVGHTTNFVQRKHAHKQTCINDKSLNYKCKLYEVIRNNGGWQNWKMEIINFFNCLDHYEARKKEQEYFISLNANLNSIEPMPTKKHKEIIEPMPTKKYKEIIEPIQKPREKYNCETCNFTCSKKSNFAIHFSTNKHIERIKMNEFNAENAENKTNDFICKFCNKLYKARNSLWYHEKKCTSSENKVIVHDASSNELKVLTSLVIEVMKTNTEIKKQNQDLQKQIMDVCKHIQPSSVINNK